MHQVGAAPGRRPATSASGPIAPPAAFPFLIAGRLQSPQPVVKSAHMSTFVFFWIIIKLLNRIYVLLRVDVRWAGYAHIRHICRVRKENRL